MEGPPSYVDVPLCATRLPEDSRKVLRPKPRIQTSLPHPPPDDSPTNASPLLSPNKSFGLLPNILVSSALGGVPTSNQTQSTTVKKDSKHTIVPLLSKKDPLSIPITTANFRRFVGAVGPVFWVQDRIEEIVMWRKGWKHTAIWMAAYVFLCMFLSTWAHDQ
jgi:hypothetical protein